jgi:hypothetical protein
MVTFLIVVVCLAMMGIFLAVTVAGGRAHDRRNQEMQAREKQRQQNDVD